MGKEFYAEPDSAKAKYVLKLSQTDLARFIPLISGHNSLFYFRSKIDAEVNPSCRFCMEAPDTFMHFVNDCPLLTGEMSFLIKLYPMTTCGRYRPYSTFHLSQGLMMPYVVTRGSRSSVNTMTKARSHHLRTPRIRTLRDRLDQQCQGLHRGRTTLTTVMVAPVLTISATTTNSTEPMTYSSSPMNSHHVYKSYKKMSSTTATRYVNSATTQPSFENGLLSWKE